MYRIANVLGPVAVIVSVLVAGCAGLKTDYEIMKQRALAYVAAHPDLAPGTAAAIRANEIRDGMTFEQVIAAWGEPAVVEKYRGGAQQYWYFGCHWPHFCTSPDRTWRRRLFPEPDEIYQSRALFENGKVVDWRD